MPGASVRTVLVPAVVPVPVRSLRAAIGASVRAVVVLAVRSVAVVTAAVLLVVVALVPAVVALVLGVTVVRTVIPVVPSLALLGGGEERVELLVVARTQRDLDADVRATPEPHEDAATTAGLVSDLLPTAHVLRGHGGGHGPSAKEPHAVSFTKAGLDEVLDLVEVPEGVEARAVLREGWELSARAPGTLRTCHRDLRS